MFSTIDYNEEKLERLDYRDVVSEEKNIFFECELLSKESYFGINKYKVTIFKHFSKNVFLDLYKELFQRNAVVSEVEVCDPTFSEIGLIVPFNLKNLIINCDRIETLFVDRIKTERTIQNLVVTGSVGDISGDHERSQELNVAHINIAKSVYRINPFAFYYNKNLRSFNVGGKINKVLNYAFDSCYMLKNFAVRYGIEEISANAFSTTAIEQIPVSNMTTQIGAGAFSNCVNIEEVTIPSSVLTMGNSVFVHCCNLKKVVVEKGAHNFDNGIFSFCQNLQDVEMGLDCKFNGTIFSYCNKLNHIKIGNAVVPKYKILDLTNDGVELLKYAIQNKKFIPFPLVANNLPKNYYDKFYDYSKLWQGAVISKFGNSVNGGNTEPVVHRQLEAYFKLAFALGLFEGDKQTVKAYRFLTEKFCNNSIERTSLSDYAKLNVLEKGFNPEFAEFYMTNFHGSEIVENKKIEFLEFLTKEGFVVKCASKVFNDWEDFKSFYPNKVAMKTNALGSNYNALTEENAINYSIASIYSGVEEGCEELALICSTYGYSQELFNRLQTQFLQGMNISKKQEKLYIGKDIEPQKKVVTYKVLSRKDVKTPFTGERNNCCMTVQQSGRFPLEYGLTKPNARFIEFYYDNLLVGSSLVWYNANTGVVCLDNIEIPTTIVRKNPQRLELEESFLLCLKRLRTNIKKEMLKKFRFVTGVAIGVSNNDLEILDLKLNRHSIDNRKEFLPKDYSGYSDAKDAVYYIEDFK